MNSFEVFLTFLIVLLFSGAWYQAAARDAQHPDEWVFYGYAPPTVKPIFHGTEGHRYVGSPPQLTIVGVHDGTSVKMYSLTDKGGIASFIIDRTELRRIPLTNETYFKVVSDKRVSVLLSGGGGFYGGIHGASTFYPSIDGGYVGYEFVFAPVNSTNGMLHVFFIEDAHATVQDAQGNVVEELEANAGATKTTYLRKSPGEAYSLALETYTVVSTGRIMLAGLDENSFLYLPCLTGGFVGRHFLGAVVSGVSTSIIVVALEDAEVVIYDLRRPNWHMALLGPDAKMSVSAGERHNTTIIGGIPVKVESTGNISVLMTQGGFRAHIRPYIPPELIGDDVGLVVVEPDQEFGFFVPTEAVVFAHEGSVIEVDEALVTLRKDEYLRLTQGVHTVNASGPVTIEILGHGWEYDVGEPKLSWHYDNYACYLVSYQGFTQSYPEPPSVGGLGEIIPYIAIGIAIPMFLVIAILVRKRARREKTEATTALAQSFLAFWD
jgi:hypothetical protein